jgi:hypothetical protein
MAHKPVEVLAAAFPGRTPEALEMHRKRLVRSGSIGRRRARNFQRTPDLDAHLAVAVVCGASLEALAERFGRDVMAIHRWKCALGVVGPRDRGAMK